MYQLFLSDVCRHRGQVYLDDAAGDRLWVDSEECRPFVDNVVTAFGTRVSPKSMLQPDITLAGRPDCPSPPGAACESAPPPHTTRLSVPAWSRL